jgi:hypothetical protein
MTIVPFSSRPAQPPAPGAKRLFLVVEIAPGGDLTVRRPVDLKALKEGRVLSREFMVLTSEEEAVETASVLSYENPGRSYAAVEVLAFAFDSGTMR